MELGLALRFFAMMQLIKKLKLVTQRPTNNILTARTSSLRFNCPYKGEEREEDVVPGRLHSINIGDVIRGYRVVQKLGSGRFSTSWVAEAES